MRNFITDSPEDSIFKYLAWMKYVWIKTYRKMYRLKNLHIDIQIKYMPNYRLI